MWDLACDAFPWMFRAPGDRADECKSSADCDFCWNLYFSWELGGSGVLIAPSAGPSPASRGRWDTAPLPPKSRDSGSRGRAWPGPPSRPRTQSAASGARCHHRLRPGCRHRAPSDPKLSRQEGLWPARPGLLGPVMKMKGWLGLGSRLQPSPGGPGGRGAAERSDWLALVWLWPGLARPAQSPVPGQGWPSGQWPVTWCANMIMWRSWMMRIKHLWSMTDCVSNQFLVPTFYYSPFARPCVRSVEGVVSCPRPRLAPQHCVVCRLGQAPSSWSLTARRLSWCAPTLLASQWCHFCHRPSPWQWSWAF